MIAHPEAATPVLAGSLHSRRVTKRCLDNEPSMQGEARTLVHVGCAAPPATTPDPGVSSGALSAVPVDSRLTERQDIVLDLARLSER